MGRRKSKPQGPSQLAKVDPTAQRGEKGVSCEVRSARLDEVELLMASNATSHQVAEHCRRSYGISDRTARDYQKEIRDRWISERKAARPERLRQLERMLELAYQKAMACDPPQISAAIRAGVELARLAGAYAPGEAPDNREPEQHTHLHAHATVVKIEQIDTRAMTPLEREAEIRRLEEKRRISLAAPAREKLKRYLDVGTKEPSS